MRTHEEIAARVCELRGSGEDFFGFQSSDLVEFLPIELAVVFLNDPKGEWVPNILDKVGVLDRMKDYMVFALDKAGNHRGLSANRSIDHFKAWVWLLGDEDYQAINWEKFQNYGVPILKQICDRFGFEFSDDYGLKRMANGEPCYDGCDMGCGK